MIEKTLLIEDADPQAVYGTNNRFVQLLKNHFPKIKITARGHELKVNGDEGEIEKFESIWGLVLEHIHKYNTITENQLERIIGQTDADGYRTIRDHDGTLVHGVSGRPADKELERAERALRAWADSMGSVNLAVEPSLARYDPPWTPPFLRRTELLLEMLP